MSCDIMKETQNFLEKFLSYSDSIVVGISGGPDSMCLLNLLINLREKFNLKIICAHVNHGLRKESDSEKIFVENYCANNNVIFEYMKIDNYHNNKFSENEAREKRYTFFNELIKKYKAKYLMTAHHGDDLIETILMRIVRGSNLKGYAGISRISEKENYQIIRPLISASKKEIIEYLNLNNIDYVIDESNKDQKYTRNRYRQQVLPFLEQEDKNVNLKFLKYSEELNKYNKYITKIIKDKIKNIYNNNTINISELLKEDEFIIEKIIEYVIMDIQSYYLFNISDKQFMHIMNLLKSSGNKQISLSDGFIARKSYNNLYIEKNKISEEYEYTFVDKVQIENKIIEQINSSSEKSNFVLRINSEEITLPIIIRTVHKGDKIKIKNLNGSKKVSDIFIDAKIDKEKRKCYPIVTDSKNNIIWIPGIKKSTFDKEIFEKYDIILKYMEEII